METIQIKIDPCPDNNFNFQKPSRSRKISFDHGRRVNLADINGNHGHRMLTRRKSSCESSGLLTSLPVRRGSGTNLEPITDVPDWQKSLMKQIETLVINSNHTDSMKFDIESELGVINEGVIPQTSEIKKPRTRRKSCMHTANHSGNFSHPTRKVSHGNFNHLSVPAASHGQITNTNANNRRRKSYANIEHHIARTSRSGSVGNLKDTLPFRGRLNSVCHHGPLQIPLIRQRRKSSAKPPTFTVSKITSVQRKLHNIYRRRRRKELRHVEQIIAPSITVDQSGDDANDNSVENVETEENLNETENGEIEAVNDQTFIAENDNNNCNLTVEEPTPVARRKCSIQIRYFEISRKLRQKRRERKKGSINSETDNDNDIAQNVGLGPELE